MAILDTLMEKYSTSMQATLDEFGVKMPVSSTIEYRSAEDFKDTLNFAHVGLRKTLISILIGSEGAKHNGQKITTMLVPYTPHGMLQQDADNTKFATDLFYICEEGVVKPIKTDKPVVIDGLNTLFSLIRWDYDGPQNLLMNRQELIDICRSKLDSKEALSKRGILVPKHKVIETEDLGNLEDVLLKFANETSAEGFVVKTDKGSCGDFIKLYEFSDLQDSQEYIQELVSCGKKVFVEERIMPLKWKNEAGEELDWNLRVLITMGENPVWLDSEVRYMVQNKRKNEPVNISKGCAAEELDVVLRATELTFEELKEYSIKTIRALYDSLKEQLGSTDNGFVGLDFLPAKLENGKVGIYMIEPNSGAVGGFATITRLRSKPLDCVKIFIESFGAYLSENHNLRNEAEVKTMPNNNLTNMCLGLTYSAMGNHLGAVYSFKKAIQQNPEWSDAYRSLQTSLEAAGEFSEAKKVQEEVRKIDSKHLEMYQNLQGILVVAGKEKEAKRLNAEIYKLQQNLGDDFPVGQLEPVSKYNLPELFEELNAQLKSQDDTVKASREMLRLTSQVGKQYYAFGTLVVEVKKLQGTMKKLQKDLQVNLKDPAYSIKTKN